MKTMRNTVMAILATTSLAFAASPAFAYKGGCDYGPGAWDGTRAERMQERMQLRHERLHKDLKLTAAQEPAWQAFIENAGPAKMMANADWKAMENLSAPERMEKMLKFSEQHQARMQERLAALKTFYAALTPEQQKIMDDHFPGPGNRRGMNRGR